MQNEAGESLKNVVLVMHSSGLLVPPPLNANSPAEDQRTEAQRELWQASVARIERVLPGFLAEAVPPTQPKPAAVTVERPVSESTS
jgi:brefeldin A-resistance guanine nucleotide exchange factor 1